MSKEEHGAAETDVLPVVALSAMLPAVYMSLYSLQAPGDRDGKMDLQYPYEKDKLSKLGGDVAAAAFMQTVGNVVRAHENGEMIYRLAKMSVPLIRDGTAFTIKNTQAYLEYAFTKNPLALPAAAVPPPPPVVSDDIKIDILDFTPAPLTNATVPEDGFTARLLDSTTINVPNATPGSFDTPPLVNLDSVLSSHLNVDFMEEPEKFVLQSMLSETMIRLKENTAEAVKETMRTALHSMVDFIWDRFMPDVATTVIRSGLEDILKRKLHSFKQNKPFVPTEDEQKILNNTSQKEETEGMAKVLKEECEKTYQKCKGEQKDKEDTESMRIKAKSLLDYLLDFLKEAWEIFLAALSWLITLIAWLLRVIGLLWSFLKQTPGYLRGSPFWKQMMKPGLVAGGQSMWESILDLSIPSRKKFDSLAPIPVADTYAMCAVFAEWI